MRFAGAAYRAHNPRWSWTPLSGEGARIHGGRFNAKGTPALYLALDLNTAIIEFNQGFPFRLVPPVTIVSYAVDCDDLIDLTNGSERRRLAIAGRHGLPLEATRRTDRRCHLGQSRIACWPAGRRVVVPSYSPGGRRCSKPGAVALERYSAASVRFMIQAGTARDGLLGRGVDRARRMPVRDGHRPPTAPAGQLADRSGSAMLLALNRNP